MRRRPALAIVAVCAVLAGCDISQSARTGPVDDLDDADRPFAAPVGAVVAADLPEGVRATFDLECLGAAYLLGFGRDQLLVPEADPATLSEASFVTGGPSSVDAGAFIDSIEQCGDVRVYAMFVGGTRWSTAPLTDQQLRCGAGAITRERGSELLRASVVVDETLDELGRDEATREIVTALRGCGAPMTDVG